MRGPGRSGVDELHGHPRAPHDDGGASYQHHCEQRLQPAVPRTTGVPGSRPVSDRRTLLRWIEEGGHDEPGPSGALDIGSDGTGRGGTDAATPARIRAWTSSWSRATSPNRTWTPSSTRRTA